MTIKLDSNGIRDWVQCHNCGVLINKWHEDKQKRPWCDICWAERNKHAAILDVLREAVPLRDVFAAIAMHRLMGEVDGDDYTRFLSRERVAEKAYVQADAMLAARQPKETKEEA